MKLILQELKKQLHPLDVTEDIGFFYITAYSGKVGVKYAVDKPLNCSNEKELKKIVDGANTKLHYALSQRIIKEHYEQDNPKNKEGYVIMQCDEVGVGKRYVVVSPTDYEHELAIQGVRE